MAEKDKKDEDPGKQDAENQNNGSGDNGGGDSDGDDDTDEEAGWARMSDMIETAVGKKLEEWQAKQKTTSSNSRRKEAPKKPARKQGFLSGQFFSNLNPMDDDRR